MKRFAGSVGLQRLCRALIAVIALVSLVRQPQWLVADPEYRVRDDNDLSQPPLFLAQTDTPTFTPTPTPGPTIAPTPTATATVSTTASTETGLWLFFPLIQQSHTLRSTTSTPTPTITPQEPPTLTPSPTRVVTVNALRAARAYNAMQRYFYRTDGTSLYLETWPQTDQNPYAYHWSFSHATSATLDMAGLSPDYQVQVQDRIHGGSWKYWDDASKPPGYDSYVVPPLGSGGDKFYDDNAWSALNLVRAYRTIGDRTEIDRAQQVFEFIKSGWDNDPSHPAPGGVFWVQAGWSRDRNTVSNAPAAELGLRLYLLTGNQSDLVWAKKMYGWVQSNMLDTDNTDAYVDGLYWDHINLNGVIDKTQWSYNQGSMIGAGVLLYTITGDGVYLEQAKRTANTALQYYGRIGYFTQPPAFNAIFFRNLLLLASVDRTYLPQTLAAMQQYADAAWTNNRSETDMFYFPANADVAQLTDQAAMTEIFACLAWDPNNYDLFAWPASTR